MTNLTPPLSVDKDLPIVERPLDGLLSRLTRLHAEATEPHPVEETSDRCDAVTMLNVNVHKHNQWVRRVNKARLDLLPVVAEVISALTDQSPAALARAGQ